MTTPFGMKKFGVQQYSNIWSQKIPDRRHTEKCNARRRVNEEKFRKLERDLEDFKIEEKKLLCRLKKVHISCFNWSSNFGYFLQIKLPFGEKFHSFQRTDPCIEMKRIELKLNPWQSESISWSRIAHHLFSITFFNITSSVF